MEQEKITLTRAEMKKVLVVEKILDGRMTTEEGGAVLGLSKRQVIRLKQTYEAKGAQGLAHKNRGRKPIHTLPEKVKDQVIELYTTKYHGSNNCHLAELLEEHESLRLSSSSVRRILLDKGIKKLKQHRRSKSYQPRTRKPQAGMLWQIDATSYAWLEERALPFTLHGAIDDATGTVVGAVFRPTECREGYCLVMQQGIKKYGVPLGLYSDRHTIFRSPNEKLTLEQELAGQIMPLSHFGKAMAELHIEHIKAITPQAKGRIERLWGTLQDRLVIELRLLGVNTLEQANKVLPGLLKKHNDKFAVKPLEAESAYVTFDEKQINLDYVFSIRQLRQLGHGNTLSYQATTYTFAEPSAAHFEVKTVLEVRQTLSGEVFVWHNGQAFRLKETHKPLRLSESKNEVSALPRKPASTHPWRKPWKHDQSHNTKVPTNFQAT